MSAAGGTTQNLMSTSRPDVSGRWVPSSCGVAARRAKPRARKAKSNADRSLQIVYSYQGSETPGKSLLKNKTIGHQLPQIFNLQILELELLFDAVKLPVAAVAWNHNHPGPGGPDLIDLSSGIKRALVVIAVYQRTAATAATDLIHAIGVKIHPVWHALVQNPSRLFKITVSKPHLSFAAAIARIMIGCQNIKRHAVKFDPFFFDIPDQQVINRYKFKFFKRFRKVFFETRPGR